MAKRRSEIVAASLLTAWTDADTAMQIVGSSLGVFGAGSLEPTRVLSTETPLRNALFDVLLSLVEGGALEIRIAPDNRYAFRWRDDVALAGLAPDGSPAIDLAVPSPYLAELEQAQVERDDALARAQLAEALAAERERLLRIADARAGEPAAVPAPAPAPSAAPPVPSAEKPARKPAAKRVVAKPPPKPGRAKAVRKRAATIAPEPVETNDVLYLTPPDAAAEPDIELTLAESTAAAAVDQDVEGRAAARRPKWSGYAIDRSRKHLAGVDRLVEDG